MPGLRRLLHAREKRSVCRMKRSHEGSVPADMQTPTDVVPVQPGFGQTKRGTVWD
jgi:hypothetical protein